MKGDFSEWKFDPLDNFTGVLHQQGRALLDQDWNAASSIGGYLRQLLGRDAIGAHVAAIPAEVGDSFRVLQAEADASGVTISLNPGRGWIDGLPLQVDDWGADPQPATYLPPPFHVPAIDTGSIATGVRDAVVLEVWEGALNGFQNPLELLEPALGGVDTTERVQLARRLRLLRLQPDDECGNLADRLDDHFAAKGKLTVTAEQLSISGDCPLEAGGGYTGFEHYLYRIEIADPDGASARFKWSRFNGGLVGRGVKSTTEDKISIEANDQSINHCGLTSFYLEALEQSTVTGEWIIVFTADATLVADGELDLNNITGAWPGGDGADAFFRLWDGIADIGAFPLSATPVELELGLRLQFDAAAADNSNYTPGDFWNFPVRAAGAVGFDPASAWPDAAVPEGVHYHRVPLAIVTWSSAVPTTATAPADIHDCRSVFQPLTRLDSCCSYTVGDGMNTHGDFDKIQDAIDSLPADGGEICVLAGDYRENLTIDRSNVIIHGCGDASHLTADSDAPAVHIHDVEHVQLLGLHISAHDDGIGVLVSAEQLTPRDICIEKLTVDAATRSAIEVDAGLGITVRDNRVLMQDVPSAFHAVFVTADDVLIEHNLVRVLSARAAEAGFSTAMMDFTGVGVAAGRGGIHIGGTSERVQVIDNLIQGGIGNGITLGSLVEVNADEGPFYQIGWIIGINDPCNPCAPGSVYIPPGGNEGDGTPVYQSAGALYEIRIERNRIFDFGLNGIGVVGFFDLSGSDEFISVNQIQILGNTIQNCLSRPLQPIQDDMLESMGYGGISLADVENALIHDNRIIDNGPDHLQPVCGIYVLHAEGLDIARNRILNNGAKTTEPATKASNGPRAGIWVQFATAPKVMVEILKRYYPRQNGVPAVSVHENIVSQPLGRALSINALGPVSVQGNQLTSQGFVFAATAPSFMVSCVYIFNLGISNELYLQQIFYSGWNLDDVPVKNQPDPDYYIVSQPGLDDQRAFGYLGNGNVQVNDNQIMLDLTDRTGLKFGISSIGILTLDDLAFQNNECDISYDLIFDEIYFTQALMIGWTVRVSDNRFKESLVGALYSALTMSLFANVSTQNQATHCIFAINLTGASRMHDSPNDILFDLFGLCNRDDNQKFPGTFAGATATQQPGTVLTLLG